MQYLADLRYDDRMPVGHPRQEEEFAHVQSLRDEGLILQTLKRNDDSGAYLVVEAPTEEHAHARLSTIPFAEEGLLKIITIDEIESI